jgi:hypothetical protein
MMTRNTGADPEKNFLCQPIPLYLRNPPSALIFKITKLHWLLPEHLDMGNVVFQVYAARLFETKTLVELF